MHSCSVQRVLRVLGLVYPCLTNMVYRVAQAIMAPRLTFRRKHSYRTKSNIKSMYAFLSCCSSVSSL